MSETIHATVPSPRTQYIFIDCENRPNEDLNRVDGLKNAQIILIVGSKQKTLPLDFTLFMQNHPERLRVVRSLAETRNAADFVLVFELAKICALDPTASFHIVSNDTGFDAVVNHMRTQKRSINRSGSLPGAKASHPNAKPSPAKVSASPTEKRFDTLAANLGAASGPRPGNRSKLRNYINSQFGGALTPAVIDKTIAHFVTRGLLTFTENDRVLYTIAQARCG